MTAITLRARGPVPAEEAWDRYARPSRWPTWSPQITRVSCSQERLAAGVRGRVHGPLGISADFVVDSWDDAARTWSWTVRRGPLRVHLEHGVRPHGSGSETWLRLPVLAGLAYLPLAQLALHRLVHGVLPVR